MSSALQVACSYELAKGKVREAGMEIADFLSRVPMLEDVRVDYFETNEDFRSRTAHRFTSASVQIEIDWKQTSNADKANIIKRLKEATGFTVAENTRDTLVLSGPKICKNVEDGYWKSRTTTRANDKVEARYASCLSSMRCNAATLTGIMSEIAGYKRTDWDSRERNAEYLDRERLQEVDVNGDYKSINVRTYNINFAKRVSGNPSIAYDDKGSSISRLASFKERYAEAQLVASTKERE